MSVYLLLEASGFTLLSGNPPCPGTNIRWQTTAFRRWGCIRSIQWLVLDFTKVSFPYRNRFWGSDKHLLWHPWVSGPRSADGHLIHAGSGLVGPGCAHLWDACWWGEATFPQGISLTRFGGLTTRDKILLNVANYLLVLQLHFSHYSACQTVINPYNSLLFSCLFNSEEWVPMWIK